MTRSDFLFLLSAAAIPIQLSKFFWPDFSFVLGIPIDYRAVAVYLADIIILAYILFFAVENLTKSKNIFNKNFLIALALLNVYLIVSSLLIKKPESVYFSLKILEFSTFSLFASYTITKKTITAPLRSVLTISLIWQSLLIFWQFLFQRSLGLYVLGERAFDSSTVGIAHVEIAGTQLLRPYGTFPHPNVAAAFLIISFLIIKPGGLFALLAILVTFLTFSKTAFVAASVVALTHFAKLKYLFLLGLALAVVAIVVFQNLPQSQVATISERLLLSETALDIAAANPLFGTGTATFIEELSKFDLTSLSQIMLLQPVHNVFLLILSENGIVGLALFAYLMLVLARSANTKEKVALFLIILIFASVDHFFWTLNQGKHLLFLSSAYIIGKK